MRTSRQGRWLVVTIALVAVIAAGLVTWGLYPHQSLFSTPTPTPTAAAEIAPETSRFSIAVIPDTQLEAIRPDDGRMADRAQWLVDNRSALNLQYVLHTGDVVNWGAHDTVQFARAADSFQLLADAAIPYSIAAGNHDTSVVGHDGVDGSRGYGGSAYVNNPECEERLGEQCKTTLLIRDTNEFNTTFPPAGVVGLGGVFEPGKSENSWSTFEAADAAWMVLTLEFHPRPEVIEWAHDVVAAHPSHNVLLQTHSYLTANSEVRPDNAGYGSTTGRDLYENLIKLSPNMKLVFSGHTGAAGHRTDTGDSNNLIVSYLGAFHSSSTNPVRIVTIDGDTGVVDTRVVAPSDQETWEQFSTTHTIDIIR